MGICVLIATIMWVEVLIGPSKSNNLLLNSDVCHAESSKLHGGKCKSMKNTASHFILHLYFSHLADAATQEYFQ